MAERSAGSRARNDVEQLRQTVSELREGLTSLVARLGDDAAEAGGRGLQQARTVAAELVDDAADRAGTGVTTLRNSIEDQPLATTAVAFLAGLALGTLIATGFGTRRPQPHQASRRR